MTEFHIIGLGNLCEFVIKNIDEKQTYGTFSACDKHDRKSMQEFVDYVNQLIKEKEKLKERIKALQKESYGNLDGINYYQEENASLSEKISNLESDLDYFRAKNGSLEEGLFQQDRKIAKLEKENKELKKEVGSFKPIIFETENGATTLYEKGILNDNETM